VTAPITDAALAEIERLATDCAAGVWPNPLQHLDDDLRLSVDRKVGHLLLALIARLRAAERAREAEGWRPIETAPRDGAPVDLWCRRKPPLGPVEERRYTDCRWGEPTFGTERYGAAPEWLGLRDSYAEIEPLYWMLPAPPAPRAEVG
jgi:hypothetical protein